MVGQSDQSKANGFHAKGCRMVEISYVCRKCSKMTRHLIRIVTENLPPNVKVLECSTCGVMGVALVDEKDLV